MLKKTLSKFLWIFIALFSFASLRAQEDVIRIELEKETSLVPVFIENTQSSQTAFSRDYCTQLESILAFDFSYNGRTALVGQKDLGLHLGETITASLLRDRGVRYTFRLNLKESYLTISILDHLSNQLCFAQDVKLSGELEKDRKKIHEASQNIHRALFDEEGIYLCQLLYTLKTKQTAYGAQPWISEVFLCDYDGANPQQVTHEDQYCVTPSYMKTTGKRNADAFFYVNYKLGQPKIYWRSISKGEEKRLTYLRGNQLMPTVSPNGNQIAFINDAPGNPELFIQDFNPGIGAIGKPRQIFSCRRGVQASPTYSPDGRFIAFVSNKDGGPKIYVMDVPSTDGLSAPSKPRMLTRKNYENTKPSWSPDGTKLAYIARVDGVRQVWIYDFITKKEWQLTHGPGNKENPVWAFNSLHIAFNSVGNSSCELYIVNLNQPKAVRVVPARGLKRFPVWVKP